MEDSKVQNLIDRFFVKSACSYKISFLKILAKAVVVIPIKEDDLAKAMMAFGREGIKSEPSISLGFYSSILGTTFISDVQHISNLMNIEISPGTACFVQSADCIFINNGEAWLQVDPIWD